MLKLDELCCLNLHRGSGRTNSQGSGEAAVVGEASLQSELGGADSAHSVGTGNIDLNAADILQGSTGNGDLLSLGRSKVLQGDSQSQDVMLLGIAISVARPSSLGAVPRVETSTADSL